MVWNFWARFLDVIRRGNRRWRREMSAVFLTCPFIECFHMTSRRPHWCPRTMKRRPCWCPIPVLATSSPGSSRFPICRRHIGKREDPGDEVAVLWELNSFLMQTLSFVPINLHERWPRERKHSINQERLSTPLNPRPTLQPRPISTSIGKRDDPGDEIGLVQRLVQR